MAVCGGGGVGICIIAYERYKIGTLFRFDFFFKFISFHLFRCAYVCFFLLLLLLSLSLLFFLLFVRNVVADVVSSCAVRAWKYCWRIIPRARKTSGFR